MQLLQSECKGYVRSHSFAFDDMLGAFGQPATRAFIVTLVAAEKFPASNAVETGGVLDKPLLATKRKLPHGGFTCVPSDGCDQGWGEAVL